MITTEEDWNGAREYWDGWLTNFETHILPVFVNRGYIKNTALMVYALVYPVTTIIDDSNEGDEWQRTNS